MRAIIGAGLAAAVLAAACVPAQTADRSQCVGLFQQYDQIARLNPTAVQNRGDRRIGWGFELDRLWRLMIQNDCQTRPGDVGDLAALAGAPIQEGGAPLGGRVAVHVGAFTSQTDTDAAIALFRGKGLQATSIGDPRLGRRVYVGPVTTQGGLDGVLGTAFEAGFVAPYASNLFRF